MYETDLVMVCLQDEHKSKKKRRSSTGDALSKLELVALGTTSGSIMLYSLTKGDLHTQLVSEYIIIRFSLILMQGSKLAVTHSPTVPKFSLG
jgi:hypothetical protein